MTSKTPQTSAGAEGCKPSRTTSTPRETPRHHEKSPATPTPARADATPPPVDLPGTLPPPAGGMGESDAGAGVGAGTHIGGGTRGRGASSLTTASSTDLRLRVGLRVRNASGRGVWGFGSIVGVIPAGTRPRWYCRRHGLPLVFGERCAPVWRDRCIVLGDDGRLHSPRNVEVCDGERG